MEAQLLGQPLYLIICYFLFYSVLGFTIECIFRSIKNKKFIYAGFLYGPYCPIYGFAAVALILFLDPVKENVFLFIILAAVITTAFEYLTGIILESFLHIRLWDYSNNRFIYKGRISLKFSICWVILSGIFLYEVYPLFNRLIFNNMSKNSLIYIAYSILFLVGIDTVASIAKGFSLRKALEKLNSLGDEIKYKSEKLKDDVDLAEENLQQKARETINKHKRFLVFSPQKIQSKKYPMIIKRLEEAVKNREEELSQKNKK